MGRALSLLLRQAHIRITHSIMVRMATLEMLDLRDICMFVEGGSQQLFAQDPRGEATEKPGLGFCISLSTSGIIIQVGLEYGKPLWHSSLCNLLLCCPHGFGIINSGYVMHDCRLTR